MNAAIFEDQRPRWLRLSRQAVLLTLAWSLPTSLFGMQAAVILGGLLLLLWTILSRGRNIACSPLDRPIGVFLLAVGLSLLLAPEEITSFRTATSLWVLAAFYVTWFALEDEKTLGKAVGGIVLLAALAAWFGVYQSLSGEYPLGSWLHPGVVPLLREVPGIPGKHGAMGFFYSRLSFAHMLLFPFCWAVSLALEPLSRRIRLLLLVAAVSIGLGLVLTWTRAALIGVVVALPTLFLWTWRAGFRRKIAGGAAVLLLAGAAVCIAPQNITRLAESFSGSRDWGRLAIWQAALNMASEHPATGFGWGNFARVSVPRIEKETASANAGEFPAFYDWAHSNLLTLLSETGFLGAFAFCFLLVAYFREARKVLRGLGPDHPMLRGFVRGAMAAVAAFLVAGLFHDSIIHAEGAFMFWFTLAASLGAARLAQRRAD